MVVKFVTVPRCVCRCHSSEGVCTARTHPPPGKSLETAAVVPSGILHPPPICAIKDEYNKQNLAIL